MKKTIIIIAIVLLILLIGGVVVGVCSKGFKNWDYKNWFKPQPTATVTETEDNISSGLKYVWISFDIDESKEVVNGGQRRSVVDQSVLFPTNEKARADFFKLVKIYCKQERNSRTPSDPDVGYTDQHFFNFVEPIIGEIDFLGTQRIADGVQVSWYKEDIREAMQFDFYAADSKKDPIFDLGGPPPVRLLFFTDGAIECIRWFDKPENSFPYTLNIELSFMIDYISSDDVYIAVNR